MTPLQVMRKNYENLKEKLDFVYLPSLSTSLNFLAQYLRDNRNNRD